MSVSVIHQTPWFCVFQNTTNRHQTWRINIKLSVKECRFCQHCMNRKMRNCTRAKFLGYGVLLFDSALFDTNCMIPLISENARVIVLNTAPSFINASTSKLVKCRSIVPLANFMCISISMPITLIGISGDSHKLRESQCQRTIGNFPV